MATSLKRFMISVTPSMEADLDVLKKERFYNNSQAEMLRYVIDIGLKSLNISGTEQLEKSQDAWGQTGRMVTYAMSPKVTLSILEKEE